MLARSNPPYKLKLPVELYVKGDAVTIERSWLVECPSKASLAYVRAKLAECMRDLDGTIVTAEPTDRRDEVSSIE